MDQHMLRALFNKGREKSISVYLMTEKIDNPLPLFQDKKSLTRQEEIFHHNMPPGKQWLPGEPSSSNNTTRPQV